MLMTPTIIKVANIKSYYKCVEKLKTKSNKKKHENDKIGDCQDPIFYNKSII